MFCSTRHTALATVLLFATAACDGSVPTATNGDETGTSDLSASETGALTEAATDAALTGFFGALSGSAHEAHPGLSFSVAGNAPPIEFTRTISHTQACPGGGDVSVSGTITGTIDSETQTGTLSLDLREDMNDCVVGTEEGQFIVNTTPDLHMQGDFGFEGGQPAESLTFSFTGSFAWSAVEGDASGSCEIDLTVTVSPSTQSGTVSGTACGEEINQSV